MTDGPISREDLPHLNLSDMTTGGRIGPVTPGEVLREEFMVPLGLSAPAVARDLGVPSDRVTQIINGQRAISATKALSPGESFGTSTEFWMNLQMAYDLEQARRTG